MELIEEADNEEEQSIRWKNRKIKQRLITYRNHLYENYVKSTADLKFALVKTFYKHHEIEIHDLPPVNKKNITLSEPLKFKDLPDRKLNKSNFENSKPFNEGSYFIHVEQWVCKGGNIKSNSTTIH